MTAAVKVCEIGLPDDSNIDRGRAPSFTHTEHIKVQKVQYATDKSNCGICLVLEAVHI